MPLCSADKARHMVRHSLILLLLCFACGAVSGVHAQSYSDAPMVIYGEGAAKAKAASNVSADDSLRELGQSTMGETITKPEPPKPATQAAPPAPAPSTSTPANPPSPQAPANPVDKLWPRNTVEIFLPSCTGLKPQFLVPCTCIITKLMITMPHDEFLKKSEDGTLEQDPRLISVRNACISDALKKKE